MGKPLAAAVGEVDFAADITEFYADNAEQITGTSRSTSSARGRRSSAGRRSGVLLGIMPWNFPYYQVARFAAPNLLIGNPILLKHAPQCPESSAAIETIYRDAGFPEGAYTTSTSRTTRRPTVIADPRVQGVSVTGSERAGSAVAEVAGRNLKKVVLELGGSDPFILLSTDDLDGAVQAAADARLDNTGQSCNAAKRFIVVGRPVRAVPREVHGGHERRRSWATRSPTTPCSARSRPSSPPSVSRSRSTRPSRRARPWSPAAPATAPSTRRPSSPDVTPEMDAYREEFFGPVGVVYRVADEDEAVKIANDTPFGLGSYVFTTDEAQAARVADKIEAGMVYVNLVLADSPSCRSAGSSAAAPAARWACSRPTSS